MDASKITVCKENMTVVRQDRLGLSPFGFLSKLFQEELEQRLQQETGDYAPLPLTLLEDEENKEEPAQPLAVEVNLDLHIDAPKQPAQPRSEEKAAPKSPSVKPSEIESRILEKVRLQERQLRQKQEVIHRLEVRLESRQQAIQTVLVQNSRTSAAPGPGEKTGEEAADQDWQAARPARLPSASQSIRTARTARSMPQMVSAVSASPKAPRTLSLASQAAAVPAAGGWVPQIRQVHPGFPAPGTKPAQSGPTEAGSILLPDVLRRRRAEALERQAEPQLNWAQQSGMPADASESLMQTVRQAVEQTLEQNRAKALGQQSWESPAVLAEESRQAPVQTADEELVYHSSETDTADGSRQEASRPAALRTPQPRQTAETDDVLYHKATPEEDSRRASSLIDSRRSPARPVPDAKAPNAGLARHSEDSQGESILLHGEQLPKTSAQTPDAGRLLETSRVFGTPEAPVSTLNPVSDAALGFAEKGSTALSAQTEPAAQAIPGENLIYRDTESGEAVPAPSVEIAGKTAVTARSVQQTKAAKTASVPAETGETSTRASQPDRTKNQAKPETYKASAPETRTITVSASGQNQSFSAVPAVPKQAEFRSVALPAQTELGAQAVPGENLIYRDTEGGEAVPAPSAESTSKTAATAHPGQPTKAAKTASGPAKTGEASARASQPDQTKNQVKPETPEASAQETRTITVSASGQSQRFSTAPAVPKQAESRSVALPAQTEQGAQAVPGENLVYRDSESGEAVPAPSAESTSKTAATVHPEQPTKAAKTASVPAKTGEVSARASQPDRTKNQAKPETPEASAPETRIITVSVPGQSPSAPAMSADSEQAESRSMALPAQTEPGAQAVPGENLVYRDAESGESALSQPVKADSAVNHTGSAKNQVKPETSKVSAPETRTITISASGQSQSFSTDLAVHEQAEPRSMALPAQTEPRSMALPAQTELGAQVVPGENLVYRDAESGESALSQPVKADSAVNHTGSAKNQVKPETSKVSAPETRTITISASGQSQSFSTDLAVPEQAKPRSMALPAQTEPEAQVVPGEHLVYRDAESGENALAQPGKPASSANHSDPAIQERLGRSSKAGPMTQPVQTKKTPTVLARPAQSNLAGMRDIRLVHAIPPAAGREAAYQSAGWQAESVEAENPLVESEAFAGVRDIRLIHTAPQRAEQADSVPKVGPVSRKQPASWQEESPSLVLAQPAPAQGQAAPKPDQQNLPDWAQNLLSKEKNAQKAGLAESQTGQVQWTAPYARPAAGHTAQLSNAAEMPAPLLHRKKEGESEEQKARRQAEKDAEVRRTADKVYRIIEERLRRELRRSGR